MIDPNRYRGQSLGQLLRDVLAALRAARIIPSPGTGILVDVMPHGTLLHGGSGGGSGSGGISSYYVLTPPGGIAAGTTESCQTYESDDATLSGAYIDVKNGWDVTDVPGSVKATVSRKPGGYKVDGWECASA